MVMKSLKYVVLFFLFAAMVAFFSGCSSVSTSSSKNSEVTAEPAKKTTKEDAERFLKNMEKGRNMSLNTLNFKDYFSINLEGSYYKDSVQIKYSIEPKAKVNIQDSSPISLKFDISIYETKYSSKAIASTEIKVQLNKDNEFRTSDQIIFELPSSDYEELFWNHELSYCLGSVYLKYDN